MVYGEAIKSGSSGSRPNNTSPPFVSFIKINKDGAFKYYRGRYLRKDFFVQYKQNPRKNNEEAVRVPYT
jgi:hypothetical protein